MRWALFLLACSANDLDPASVQAIAAGDAIGTALSGEYRVKRVTRSCEGHCGGTGAAGWPIAVCEVDDVDHETTRVIQTNGVLSAEMNDRPANYSGALNRDGSFDLGAYATQGGTLQVSVRATGMLTPGNLRGTARSRSWGSYDGVELDCQGYYDLMTEP